MKLQDIFDRCEALDDEIMAEADAAGGLGSDSFYFDLPAWEAAHDKATAKRRPLFAALQAQCAELTGHAYAGGFCVICSHDKNAHAEAIRVNLLKG